MSLSDIANLVEIVGVLAILFGIVFGIAQLRQFRIQRRDLGLLECAHSFEDKDFTEAYRLIAALEPGMSREQLKGLGEAYEAAALRVSMKFETYGLLIHRGVVPLDGMEQLVGGAAVALWRVLERWARETREARSHNEFLEWFQWFAELMQKRNRTEQVPA